ncbi:hypothetical protein EBT16_12820, partial [bacterium]|nr:hypothetical protein [bacterium]
IEERLEPVESVLILERSITRADHPQHSIIGLAESRLGVDFRSFSRKKRLGSRAPGNQSGKT